MNIIARHKPAHTAAKASHRKTPAHIVTTLVGAACACVALLVSACTAAEERYSDRPCYFVFRADYHPTHILSRVLSNPGMFVMMTAEKRLTTVVIKGEKKTGTFPHIYISAPFALSDEDKSTVLVTETENRFNYNFAANNSLIIGCSVTNEWHAYDRQCPYCLDNYSTNNFPLEWTRLDNGQPDSQSVTCAKCQRTYNLNYGSSTDGHRLVEYRVRFDGIMLVVSN